MFGIEGLAFTFMNSGEDCSMNYCYYSLRSSRRNFTNIVQLLVDECRKERQGFEPICHGLLQVLFVLISREQSMSLISDDANKILKECAVAKRYIDQNYTQNINLDLLSDITHTSKFYLAHTFTECFGSSPISYLAKKRLSAAKELLAGSNFSIAQIAVSTGFSSQSYFS